MARVVQSSFDDLEDKYVSANNNGFVNAAYMAYSHHYHLRIRPEDVWASILTQLSFYINANAEKLRKHFVAHKGSKTLVVQVDGTIDTVDHGQFARLMTDKIQENVVDKELQQWILPDFTTTVTDDVVTASVIMMGSMQKYFTYEFCLTCGIPSVTLLGEREDWVKLRSRLDKIDSWGEEAVEFSGRLKVVLDYFILSFDEPESDKVKEFWAKIAHHEGGGSGPTWLSGWIAAFCYWAESGERAPFRGMASHEAICILEGARPDLNGASFTPVDTAEIPEGYVSVPVKVNDNGKEYATEMCAGSVGISVTKSGDLLDESIGHLRPWESSVLDPFLYIGDETEKPEVHRKTSPDTLQHTVGEKTGLDTIQPVTGWWMYILNDGIPGPK